MHNNKTYKVIKKAMNADLINALITIKYLNCLLFRHRKFSNLILDDNFSYEIAYLWNSHHFI